MPDGALREPRVARLDITTYGGDTSARRWRKPRASCEPFQTPQTASQEGAWRAPGASGPFPTSGRTCHAHPAFQASALEAFARQSLQLTPSVWPLE